MRRKATFDSSFWVHATYLDLVEFLLYDYELFCSSAVETELGRDNPTSLKLKSLLADARIKRDEAKSEKIRLYGDGERAAINLALEKNLLLFIDDWRPYQAAWECEVEVVNSMLYLVRLYDESRIAESRALEAIAKMSRRGTMKREWLLEALKVIASIRNK